MKLYKKELQALKRSNRFRMRKLFDNSLTDIASNDYLGIGENKKLFKKAYKRVLKANQFSPKASMLVNGYSSIHKDFELALCKANDFEEAVIVGSGFLANISMIEALTRKGDVLFIDEQYHASGILATKLVQGKVITFNHNDPDDLKQKLSSFVSRPSSRTLIAIEGIYSMEGDLAKKEFFDIADETGAILIVDEAHSSGVIGDNLLGIFDYYKIIPKPNHIKMGTLGKAYGSYGAYILGSSEIISFLVNRAKPIVYSTAPSLFDTALGFEALKYIIKNSEKIKNDIVKKQNIIKKEFDLDVQSLIVPIKIGNNANVLQIQEKLKKNGLLVGAIRQPTVKSAIIRLIVRVNISNKKIKKACKILKEFL